MASRLRELRILPVLLLVSACGMGSHFSADGPKEFRYKPPASVSEADRGLCGARADGAARSRSSELAGSKGTETGAYMFGAIGMLSVFAMIYEAEEGAYEEEYKACLVDKGYLKKDDLQKPE